MTVAAILPPGQLQFIDTVVAQREAAAKRQEKISNYSDYHKAFYGCRPDGWLSEDETVAAYDRITAEFDELEKTPEGRARLRAAGWLV